MIVHSARALVALTLLLSVSRVAVAQDSAVTTRHLLSLDVARLQPFRRAYEMIVHTADSTLVIGERDLTLTSSEYSGAPAWLLVETRTGSVPAAESLYVAPDLRPLHLSASQGLARLGLEFVGDSIYGVATAPGGRQNVIVLGRPDLLATQAMAEVLLPLLPLTPTWSDSVGVLEIDPASHAVWPGELAVVGEEDTRIGSVSARATWVMALRAGERQVLYWMAKDTGEVLRVRQALPRKAGPGRELEYRLRAGPATEGAEQRY